MVMQSLFWDKFTMNGAQARMARAALKMSVRDLAAAAQVSPNTITRIEADLPSNPSTLGAIRRVLEAAVVEFTNGDRPGVRLRNPAAAPVAPPARMSAPGAEPSPRKKPATKAGAGKPRRPARRKGAE